ncbi:DUF502 domain-containing protein [Thermomonas sp.]|uniref:DUF502 domain-containing protein n=1 Tax=Thermomonas sp. TaxID=1971895 RepID=UPI002489EC6D|nr:DUF502 domain-containing protein [Thermomonas sp.]MDI1252063.1 DUF502 domain-containing protein [Thermomonas sp.]
MSTPASSPAPDPLSSRLQRLFITGLLTLLPLWLTWVVVKFLFVMLSDLSRPVVEPVLQGMAALNPAALEWLDDSWVLGAIAMIATVLSILLVGWLTRHVVGQRLLRWFEAMVARIPLASTIYGSARKLLDILQTKPDGAQRVVLIDFPHPEMKTLGFVTRVMREIGTGRELAAVYVPTTPNPTSGYLEIVPVEKMTPTDWTVDQAMSFIISGGAVAPSTIPFSPPTPRSTPTQATTPPATAD